MAWTIEIIDGRPVRGQEFKPDPDQIQADGPALPDRLPGPDMHQELLQESRRLLLALDCRPAW